MKLVSKLFKLGNAIISSANLTTIRNLILPDISGTVALTSSNTSVITVTQTNHGFSVGKAIYFDGTAWSLALANNANTLGTCIIESITDANNFTCISQGFLTNLLGLTAGQYYFVSATTPGELSVTEPYVGNYSNPLMQAISSTSAIVLAWRPSFVSNQCNSSALTLSDFVLKSDLTTVIPSGVIVDWSGSIADIPQFWQLCDGTNGTPDLRDKFIIGASNDNAGVPSTNVTGSLTKTGGTKDLIVPLHTHAINDPGHRHLSNSTPGMGQGAAGASTVEQAAGQQNTTINTTGITIANAGTSGTNANLPPYYALAKIMFMGNPNNVSVPVTTLPLMAPVSTTAGTYVDFTGIPSSAKRITVMFNGVSTNGTSLIQIQAGSGSVTTSGYVSTGTIYGGSNTTTGSSITTGLPVLAPSASDITSGVGVLILVSNNTWVWSSNVNKSSGNYLYAAAGNISLSGTLDRIRLTTVNGTDLFDAGTINVMYE